MQSLSSVVFVAALVAALYFCTAATRASFAASHEIQFFDLVSNRRSCLLIASAWPANPLGTMQSGVQVEWLGEGAI